MKLAMILMTLCFIGCSPLHTKEELAAIERERYENSVGFQLKGNHELLALKSAENKETNISGSYFLSIGGFSGNSKSESVAKFIYKNHLGQYVPTTLPYSMIRFEIKDTATPYVKFRWANRRIHYSEFNGSNMEFVIYAVFVINRDQIASDIKFDL